MKSEDSFQIFTYQTRLKTDGDSEKTLSSCAEVMSFVERHLFADISKGNEASALKSAYLKKFGITARHFNAIRVQLEGKIASIKEKKTLSISHIREKIEAIKKRLTKLKSKNVIHQKKRLLFNLNQRLQKLETGKISLCFGSSRLFKAQFHLEENGYRTHEEWRSAWNNKRKRSFFLLGSKDEASGNQSCTATLVENGSLSLRIRLPDCLSITHGKYLYLTGVRFAYGHQNIVKGLQSCLERKVLQKAKSKDAASKGLPISYRFKRDEKGWRLFVSVSVARSPITTSSKQGVIGIDINADHIAISETDRFGNPVAKKSIPLNTYGKTTHQAKALIGDACSTLVAEALEKGKTLVIENLDFSKKKAALKEQSSKKHTRMLSSFSYSQIKNCLKARGFREGVSIEQINPAFTSVIGRVKFSNRYGLSIHQAAALTIGRRHLKAKERVPRHLENIPDGKGNHVALSVPVRKRTEHVWSSWGVLNRQLKTVLAAHFRAKYNRSSSSKTNSCDINPSQKLPVKFRARESVNTTVLLTF